VDNFLCQRTAKALLLQLHTLLLLLHAELRSDDAGSGANIDNLQYLKVETTIKAD
jgi:hypothetical protein